MKGALLAAALGISGCACERQYQCGAEVLCFCECNACSAGDGGCSSVEEGEVWCAAVEAPTSGACETRIRQILDGGAHPCVSECEVSLLAKYASATCKLKSDAGSPAVLSFDNPRCSSLSPR